MDVLKFILKGKTAFFKKPEVNSYIYFTYGNIHKCVLLGIFGAILGYGGYNQTSLLSKIHKDKNNFLPEYYEKLENIKISIVPLSEKGSLSKKIQYFNNSVGYASKEAGGNLIVKEQWLENPAWCIYVILDNDESRLLAHYIINNKVTFNPYLGKNDHIADISNAEIIKDVAKSNTFSKIDSLALKKDFEITFEEEDEEIDYFKYEEYLPLNLHEETSLYVLEKFFYSNMEVNAKTDVDVFDIKGKNIVFY
ncbi:MAG: type I-B CRISPR-associated protein Cas5b [Clostridium sp.]|nr:type I-B CRISPR-associated protein Cas5b [Clostridium sp.]